VQHNRSSFQCSPMSRYRTYSVGEIVMMTFSFLLAALCVLAEIMTTRQDPGSAPFRSSSSVSSTNRKDRDTAPLLAGDAGEMGYCKSWLLRLLGAFRLSESLTLLLQRTPHRNMASLDGLRSFSMIWIILANTSILIANLGTDNGQALQDIYESFPQQFTLGSSLAVDTFFFLSGLLTTYTLLRRMRKTQKYTFPGYKFIALRYLRLTPLYAFILFFYAFVVPALAQGPVWYRMIKDANLCVDLWWPNLIYINNFYPTAFHSTCMSWSWYLANDMQFFVIGLLLLSVYLCNRKVGIGLTVVLTLSGVVSGLVLLLKHREDIQDDYFDKPYTRVTPFGVGILLGILFVDKELVNRTIQKPWSWMLMTLSIGVMLAVIYIDYANFKHAWNNGMGGFSKPENAVYQAVGRLLFALAISMVTLLCVTQGNPHTHGFQPSGVNWFLSLPIWEPLGKLTYGVYLVHPIVIRAYYYQKVQTFHFDVFEQTMNFMAITIMSYAIAAILHVAVEIPFANVTKLLVPAKRGGSRDDGLRWKEWRMR